MNKRKRVAWRKHRIKAKKAAERRRALPANLRQQSARRSSASTTRGA